MKGIEAFFGAVAVAGFLAMVVVLSWTIALYVGPGTALLLACGALAWVGGVEPDGTLRLRVERIKGLLVALVALAVFVEFARPFFRP